MAGDTGADWRMEPSPKYSLAPLIRSAVAGKTNGMALEASRCWCVILSRTARRWLRIQGMRRLSPSKKVTCSPEL